MAIPQTKYSHQLQIISRTRGAVFCVVALLALFVSLKTGAQEGRQPPPGGPGKAAVNSPPPTQTTPPGRLMPLRASDTASGSKVTITSDTPLNGYSAYRSGDRYYIVLPKADAGAVKSGMRGRGFDDAQVQRRGNDVVLSFRLQPGAAARVKQRFNRLDVEFAATAEAGNTPPTLSNQNTTPATIATNVPAPARPNANLNPQPTGQPTGHNLPPPVTKPAIPSNVRALPNATPNKVLAEPVSSAANVNKTPAVTPSVEQLAQAQPPSDRLKVTNPTTAVPAARVGSSLGTLVLQNWPLALILTLLLGGIGLFVAARRSTMTRDERSIMSEPAALTEKPVVTAFSPALKATKTPAANSAPEGVLTTSPSAVAAALAAAAALTAARPAKEQGAEQVAEAETPKPASVVAEKSTTQTIAAEAAQQEAALTKEIMPRPVIFSMEQVQQEAQKLFDGGPYDEAVIGVADPSMRELVSAELLAALASRNVERRERARTAFVRHGYFEDATRSLSSAEAPAERASSARTLGLLRDRAATPHLVEALKDPAPEVRRAGIDALAELRDPAAVGPLEELRAREKDQKRKMPRAIIQNAINVCAAAVELSTVASADTTAPTVLPSVAEAPVAPVREIVARESIDDSTVAPLVTVPQSEPLEETAKSEATALATPVPVDEAGAAISNAGVNVPGASAAGPTDQTVPLTLAPVTSDKAARTTAEPTPEAIAATLTAVESATRSTEEAQLADPEPQLPEMATPPERFSLSRVTDVESLTIEGMTEPEPSANEQSSLDALLFLHEVSEPETMAPTPATEEEVFELDLDEYLHPETSTPSEVTLSSAWLIESELESPPESLIEAEPLVLSEPDSLIDTQASATSLSPEIDSEVETYHFEPLREVMEAEAVSDVETERSIEVREETADDWYEIDLAQTPTLSSSLFTETPATYTPAQSFDERATVADEKAIEPAREFFSTVPKEIQERLTSDESTDRVKAVEVLSQLDTSDAFHEICLAFDDPTPDVRNAAARALYQAREDPAESFTRALREAAPERRRQIGAAISSSGIAGEALNQLTGESRDKTYEAFSLLFLMAKAGEVQPLIHAIEAHANNEVRLAVIKLLALSGQPEILPAFRRLAVRGSLPTEVRSAVMEAIYQISSGKDVEGSASA